MGEYRWRGSSDAERLLNYWQDRMKDSPVPRVTFGPEPIPEETRDTWRVWWPAFEL